MKDSRSRKNKSENLPALWEPASKTAARGDAKTRRFIGIGQFDSGIPDFAINPKYMEDFGLSRIERLKREQKLG